MRYVLTLLTAMIAFLLGARTKFGVGMKLEDARQLAECTESLVHVRKFGIERIS
jgi:hypothetical protein